MDKRTPIAKFADALARELAELWPNATVLDGGPYKIGDEGLNRQFHCDISKEEAENCNISNVKKSFSKRSPPTRTGLLVCHSENIPMAIGRSGGVVLSVMTSWCGHARVDILMDS